MFNTNSTQLVELLKKQTELLDNLTKQTNQILENQKTLLQKMTNSSAPPFTNEEEFVEDIWHDEMRSGFLVTSNRKRLWNTQIGIIKEFERICKKHNIKWFAYGGTLLGAVRHKGFIPWDDDSDVIMFRPDYEKFKKVVEQELQPPYFFDAWYDHRLESDSINGIVDENKNLPIIPLELQKWGPTWWPFWPILRIKDSRTTWIARQGCKDMPQSVFIDIFPMDPLPPAKDNDANVIFEATKILFIATIMPQEIERLIKAGQSFILPKDALQKFIELPFRKRALEWENFMANNFYKSDHFTQFKAFFIDGKSSNAYKWKSIDFEKTISLPFEKIELPIPVGYDDILTSNYGNWHEIKIFNNILADCSADIPYSEYAKKSLFMN